MPKYKHTVMAKISEKVKNNIIVCTSPSKSFNLAGMQTSNIIIPNSDIRERFDKQLKSTGFHSLNILGYKSCEIAYNECEEWLGELIQLVQKNHYELKKYIEKNLPKIKVYDLEGTYLQWMDFNALELDKVELEELMQQEAEVFFDEGYVFGEEGEGDERMNLACPTQTMMEGLERIKKAVDKIK